MLDNGVMSSDGSGLGGLGSLHPFFMSINSFKVFVESNIFGFLGFLFIMLGLLSLVVSILFVSLSFLVSFLCLVMDGSFLAFMFFSSLIVFLSMG
jgi:hypothetical protein